MSAVIEGAAPCEHPTSKHTNPSASATFDIVATLPNTKGQLRNIATVLTSRSAANCGGSGGSTEPGSVVTAVNA
ncbi:hypothetical protein NJB1728f10_36080 [Mycobacterium marinum]|nr:hypothetical protein NJB1808e29_27430 [Mycobacterium marinum]GJO30034.1 hypothetical protein NJB1728e18_45080 [Mycobacterium marinum]GJO59962.1 hypothetical protein NJB1907E39_24940 [Mycobacterium marinum]GJO66959.1 hypothetical protein NJB1728f10_36080 [Mycobacterium marinum]GJO73617.1 hypothetical protein NJB1907f34a_34490 [Mycobacterium marinum]